MGNVLLHTHSSVSLCILLQVDKHFNSPSINTPLMLIYFTLVYFFTQTLKHWIETSAADLKACHVALLNNTHCLSCISYSLTHAVISRINRCNYSLLSHVMTDTLQPPSCMFLSLLSLLTSFTSHPPWHISSSSAPTCHHVSHLYSQTRPLYFSLPFISSTALLSSHKVMTPVSSAPHCISFLTYSLHNPLRPRNCWPPWLIFLR